MVFHRPLETYRHKLPRQQHSVGIRDDESGSPRPCFGPQADIGEIEDAFMRIGTAIGKDDRTFQLGETGMLKSHGDGILSPLEQKTFRDVDHHVHRMDTMNHGQ